MASADALGSLPLDPVPTPQFDTNNHPTTPAGDPCLYYLGEYLRAVLNNKLAASWASLCPNKLPVQELAFIEPQDKAFNSRDLPGLYLYRETFPNERIADDVFVQRSHVGIRWVPPATNIDRRSDRAPFINAVSAVINQAVTRERNPAWIVAGDTDPVASVAGSSVFRWCGLSHVINLIESKRETVTISVESESADYTGLKVLLGIEEMFSRDITSMSQASVHASVMTGPNLDLDISSITS